MSPLVKPIFKELLAELIILAAVVAPKSAASAINDLVAALKYITR